MRGGSSNLNPNKPNESTSFKDILKGKSDTLVKSNHILDIHGPYIVEQLNQIPKMVVDLLEVNYISTIF